MFDHLLLIQQRCRFGGRLDGLFCDGTIFNLQRTLFNLRIV